MPLSFHKLDKATAYFHEHFNENIDIDDYIKKYETGSCASLFYRHFKEYTGQTPLQYILGIRLPTAKRMLENTAIRYLRIPFELIRVFMPLLNLFSFFITRILSSPFSILGRNVFVLDDPDSEQGYTFASFLDVSFPSFM